MSTEYKFRLQKLLEIREKTEEKEKILFMEASNEKNKVEKQLGDLKDNYHRYSSINLSKASTIERKIQHNYLNLLSNSIEKVTEELEDKKQNLELKRKDLIEAQVNRKTVEILKEKKQKEYLWELARVEQLQNDEYALYGFVRQCRR